ncbi:competence type IV pilus ATPase ComGA [Alkalicoccus urumqiensis]|uniref:Bacterial type II secretion system protein E domain-containing protein n=1 Tax=Alkalicoccus urumqiensis TaxID=1548213 RepID=A0A2P6MK78_ALKUR|nr:competence type IV pilus ATPase ComGA [Alkalicoccus urumqiensis]PRO66686.1 hypothetical protein C6I21_01800 [Alkalicoccus urumqiensis]
MDISQKLQKMIIDAVRMKASDIHLLPDASGVLVRCRIDGVLHRAERLTEQKGSRLISHLKFISGMDISERRRPQNKRLEITSGGTTIYVRVSTFPGAYLETVVLRLFPYSPSRALRELFLFPGQAAPLQKLIHSPHGLVLLCGPTGAGKTTTIYSMLHERARHREENIMTLEDPVECREDGLLQMEINEKAGVTYAAGLRSLLRHDPDLIMIGEIRDEETAAIAVRAAMSGHLVLSSLHSATAAGAVRRMMDLGIDKDDLREVLRGSCAQRLIEVQCMRCGGRCGRYCTGHTESRRKAVCEILMDERLEQVFSEPVIQEWPGSISGQVRRGIALGYIPGSVWELTGKGAWQ